MKSTDTDVTPSTPSKACLTLAGQETAQVMPGMDNVTTTCPGSARTAAEDRGATSERIWFGKTVKPRTKRARNGRSHRLTVLVRDLRNTFPVWGQHSPDDLWRYVK